MYTIQYIALSGETRTQELDVKARNKVVRHLARFKRPILEVYEQATPVTRAVQHELAKLPKRGLSNEARIFSTPASNVSE